MVYLFVHLVSFCHRLRYKRDDDRPHNLIFLCCPQSRSILTSVCVCEKRKQRQNALNLSWPFGKGWKTWKEMSIEAIRTGGALNTFRKRDVSTTASKIEVGRGPIDSTIFSTAPLHLSFYSQTCLWSLLMRGEQSSADGVKWRKKEVLKSSEKQENKKWMVPLSLNMVHFGAFLKVIKCTKLHYFIVVIHVSIVR